MNDYYSLLVDFNCFKEENKTLLCKKKFQNSMNCMIQCQLKKTNIKLYHLTVV